MAQTLGTDVPFVTLTGSEVFSLEVSQLPSSRRREADRVDVKNGSSYSGISTLNRCQDQGGNRVD
jgi:hypothetical protein